MRRTHHRPRICLVSARYRFQEPGTGALIAWSKIAAYNDDMILLAKTIASLCFTVFSVSAFGLKKQSRLSDTELIKLLTPTQYQVACQGSTEPPFKNAYWDHKEPGIYVDVISGKPLFSSLDKFDSRTGWPSFTKPIDESEIVRKEDRSINTVRTEVRSKTGEAHLGHVFEDGPKDRGGLRFCINSASLKFIHKDELDSKGYGQYQSLFSGIKPLLKKTAAKK